MKNDLKSVLLEHRDEYVDFLKELVACDTCVIGHGIQGGNEINGQRYLEKRLRDMGAQTKREPLTEEAIASAYERYQEGNLNHCYDNERSNLYGYFRGKSDKTLLFNGHVDTMPTGRLEDWQYPPFSSVIADGRLYGRGSSDMKGGLAAAVMAVKLLQDAGDALPCNVTIMSVADEEGGGNGTIAGCIHGVQADAAVVCEPTNGQLYTSSMGFLFVEVRLTGVSLHSAEKWKGVSAIEKAIYLIDRLDRLEHRWIMENKHPHLPAPTLNVGVIHGGIAGSVVPNDCCFRLCAHYHPKTMSYAQTLKDIADCIETACDGDPWLREHRPEYFVYQAGQAHEVDEKEQIVQRMLESYAAVTGEKPIIGGASYGADARSLANIAGIPSVIMGPGDISVAHAPNEYIVVSDYLEMILVYAKLIQSWK